MATDAPIVLPYTFTNRTAADATQINANLVEIETKFNNLLTRAGIFRLDAYGADPAGISDSSAAFAALRADVIAAGGGTVQGTPGATYKFATAAGSALMGFSGINGICVDAAHSTFLDTTTYGVTDLTNLFQFTACKGLAVRLGQVTSQNVLAQTGAAGLTSVALFQGCDDIDVYVRQTGGKGAVIPQRSIGDSTSYSSRGIRGRVIVTNAMYGYNGQLSGDDVNLQIDANGCYRSYFVYGCGNHQIQVRQKDNVAQNLVTSDSNGGDTGCHDLNVAIYDRESAPAGAAEVLIVRFRGGDVNGAATHRNVNFDLNLDLSAGTARNGVTFDKLKADASDDATGRGHILDGCRITGYCKVQTGARPIQYGFNGSYAAPDAAYHVYADLRTEDGGTDLLLPPGGIRRAVYAGSPENHVGAPTGSWCADSTNGDNYIKATGVNKTGWKAVTHA